jgi:DNA-damage-inducible protein D
MSGEKQLIVFDEIRYEDVRGSEYWSARDLMKVLGYTEWRNFLVAIKKAKESYASVNGDISIADHFVDANKVIIAGKGAKQTLQDYHLSRYACYLIAQNGDPRKPEIAIAQTYFAIQTRRQEQADIESEEMRRLEAREKYRISDKKMSAVILERDVNRAELAKIKSNGDKVLFGGKNTAEMKKQLGQRPKKPLVDVLPAISITAKQLANEMTHINTVQNDLRGFPPIDDEHKTNNKTIRDGLLSRGIKPEELPPAPDIAKIERKVTKKIGGTQNDN